MQTIEKAAYLISIWVPAGVLMVFAFSFTPVFLWLAFALMGVWAVYYVGEQLYIQHKERSLWRQ